MNEISDVYTDLIKRYAYVALKKVRKPSDYDLNDFIQEGIKMYILVKRDMYDPNRGSSFKSFFTGILRQHFGGIVTKSYRYNKAFKEARIPTLARLSVVEFSHSVFDIVSMRHILQDFTKDELEYVKTVFLFVDKPVKFRRKFVRKALSISYDREQELRNSIHDKILK